MDASNLLKPALAQGTLRCIGSTTYKEYRQYFEKDRALVRRFQKIDVKEPSVADAVEILKGLKPYFEEFHKVRYTQEAVKAAVELSARYIHDRKLPDKAIDVIDETGASQMLVPEAKRKKTIGIKEIEATIASMARIPPKSVSKDDAEVLQHLDEATKGYVGSESTGAGVTLDTNVGSHVEAVAARAVLDAVGFPSITSVAATTTTPASNSGSAPQPQ